MSIGFLIAIATMGGLGFLFAGGLAIADRKLRVEENPLIGKINDVLPGANCGACGNAGCYDFAVKLVDGKEKVTGCPVGGEETAQLMASIMGIEAGASVKMIPRVLCRGGNKDAVKKMAEYYGPLSCSVMQLVGGGDKMCYYGCLGGGDCVEACPFNAMIMTDDGLPTVVEELCTGCGMCVQACPRDVIEMHPQDVGVLVYCKSHDDPKTSKSVCKVSCIGCGICARKSEGGIEMVNSLPEIHYDKLDPALVPFEKCPTKAITNLNAVEHIIEEAN